MVILELIQNIALLLSLSLVYQAMVRLFPHKNYLYIVLSGILFGGIAILVMMTPLTIADGIIIDGRSVILSMAGFIAGPVVALIASILCAAYRIWLGGIGSWFGVGTIFASAAIGSVFYFLSKKKKKNFSSFTILLFGLLVHGINMIPMLFMPAELQQEIIHQIGIQYLILFPLATVILYLIFQDTNSHLREREALKISEQRFHLASEASKLGVWYWDLQADEIQWDDRCWKMLGYEPAAFPLNYQVWEQLVHPSERQNVIKTLQSNILYEDSFCIEFRFRTANGEWLWTEGCGKVISRDAANHPLQMSGIFLDVSQRKQLTEKLSQKEKIFTHSLDMLCIAGFDGFFKVVNPAWTKALGWEMSELLERPWMDFVHPEDKKSIEQLDFTTLDGQNVYKFENRFLCKDGSIKWFAWKSFSYPEDSIAFGVARDITDQRETEKELRNSERKYRELFTEMTEGFALHEMIYDEDGRPYDYRFIDLNPAFERLTGLRHEEIMDHTVLEVLPVTEQYWIDIYAEVAKTGVPRHFENYSQALDKWFSVNVYSPKTGQFATSFFDITDQKNIEHQLKESLDKLELLFDSLPVGISILDKDNQIVRQNTALAEIYGLSSEEMLAGEHRKRHYIHQDGTPMPREEFASSRIQRGEQRVKEVILGTEKEDGAPLWLEINGVACALNDWHAILLTQDVTDRMLMKIENDYYLKKINQHSLEQETMLWLTVSLREAKTRIQAQDMVVKLIVDTYPVDTAAVFQFTGQSFTQPILAGLDTIKISEIEKTACKLFRDVLDTGTPRLLHTHEEIDNVFSQKGNAESGLESCIIFPIFSGTQKIGILLAGNQKSALPFDDLITPLAAMAEIMGVTLQRMGNLESMKEMISRRTLELSTLYNVIAVSGVQKTLAEKLEISISEVMQVLACNYGGIFFLNENRNRLKMVAGTLGSGEIQRFIESSPLENLWEGRVVQQAESVIIPNILENPYYQLTSEYHEFPNHVFIGVPILLHEQVYGLVSVFREGAQIFNVEEITFLNALVNHIGVMIENHNLIEEAEQATLKEERNRISHQMHDSVTQTLYSAVLFANAGQDLIRNNKLEQVNEVLNQLSQLTKQALNEMRLMLFEMRPPDLAKDGLIIALRKRLDLVEKRASIQTKFVINQTFPVSSMIEDVLYWVVIEALNNITRHAKATEISLEFYVDSTALTLSICDNGVGFDPLAENNHGGHGLVNMQERMQKISGTLGITSNNGEGTIILIKVPNGSSQMVAREGIL